jgi:hypothetical protein
VLNSLEVARISGGEGEMMLDRDSGDHGVGAPDRLPGSFEIAVDSAGHNARVEIKGKNFF